MGNAYDRFDRRGIKTRTTMPSSRRFPPPRSPTTSAAVLSRRLGTTKAVMAYSVDRVGLYASRGRDMYLLASPRHFCALLIVSILTAILAFPAIAQTSSDSDRTGTASAPAQSELTGGPTSSNPATPKTGSNTATPSTETNSPAAKAESEPGGAQSESNPGIKKVGSAVVISIDKTKQEMTVLVDGIEKYHWPVSTGRAGYSTPSGTYTATSMNEIWYSKQ